MLEFSESRDVDMLACFEIRDIDILAFLVFFFPILIFSEFLSCSPLCVLDIFDVAILTFYCF